MEQQIIHGHSEIEGGLDAATRGLRELQTERFIAQNTVDRLGKGEWIVGRNQNRRAGFRRKNLARAADVGRHDWHAGRSRFEQHAAERLLPRRVDQERQLGKQRLDIPADAEKI